MSFTVTHPEVQESVKRALAEDIDTGDLTTNLCVPADASGTGRMIARQDQIGRAHV